MSATSAIDGGRLGRSFTLSLAIHTALLMAGAWMVHRHALPPEPPPLQVTVRTLPEPLPSLPEPAQPRPVPRAVAPEGVRTTVPKPPPEPRASAPAAPAAPPPPVVAIPADPAPAPPRSAEPERKETTTLVAPPPPAPAPVAPPPVAVAAPPAATVPISPASAAAYLNNPEPAYPSRARREGLEGTVRLAVLVTADGHAGKVEIRQSSGAPVLDEAALTAVRSWRFVPAKRGREPVEDWVQIPIVFRLEAR